MFFLKGSKIQLDGLIDLDSVVDVDYNLSLEAELIKCFLNENDIVIFPWAVSNFKTYTYDPENMLGFIRDHEVFETNYTLPIERKRPGRKRMYTWFSPNTDEELIKIINLHRITYSCCIIEKNKPIEEFSYYLDMYEHHFIENDEYRSLFIYENGNHNFENRVLPKLENLIENYKAN